MPDIDDIWDDDEDNEQVRRLARVPAPAEEPRDWLIRKGGYFYRPNFCGYTAAKHEAGRYTRAEAEKEVQVEPWHMKAMHEDEWPNDPTSAKLSDQSGEIAALKALIADMAKAAEAVLNYATMDDVLADKRRSPNSVFGIRIADLRNLAAAAAKAKAVKP